MLAAEKVWRGIKDRFRIILEPPRDLWLTGHSLGGALATIISAKLKIEKIADVFTLNTFGQPALGDHEFCRNFREAYCDNSFSFVNFKDDITNIPPGYFHPIQQKYFNIRGELRDRLSMMEKWDNGPHILRRHSYFQYLIRFEKLFYADRNILIETKGQQET